MPNPDALEQRGIIGGMIRPALGWLTVVGGFIGTVVVSPGEGAPIVIARDGGESWLVFWNVVILARNSQGHANGTRARVLGIHRLVSFLIAVRNDSSSDTGS